jgi:hypothetical protein
VRVTEFPGRDGEQGFQQMHLLLIQHRVSPPAALILQRRGIRVLRVGLDPIGDALASYSEHAGDVGGGATMVELQDGQHLAIQPSIAGLGELTSEAPPLPGS